MEYLKNLIYIFVGTILLIYITTSIASFFNISIADYGNYLFFICALVIFYAILPKNASRNF